MSTVEAKECAGTNIYLLNDFLSEKECNCIISELNKIDGQQVIIDSVLISKIMWAFIEYKIKDVVFEDMVRGKPFKVIGITNQITVSRNYFGIGRHRDDVHVGVPFKMGFYLNNLSRSAGTNFYENGEKKIEVESKMGSGVLFDISLEHESQKIPYGEIKYMIGVRPLVKYL